MTGKGKTVFSIFMLLLSSLLAMAQEPASRHIELRDGLGNSTVYYAMQDRKGYIWFCTETGVNRFDGHQFETFLIQDGLADNLNFRCYEDSKGRIWFLSHNSKISYYQNGSFYNEINRPGLKLKNDHNSLYIFDCQEDSSGAMWLSNSLGTISYVKNDTVQQYNVPGNWHTTGGPMLFKEDKHLKFFLSDPKNQNIYVNDLTNGKKIKLKGENYTKDINSIKRHSFVHTSDSGHYFIIDNGIFRYLNNKLYPPIKLEQQFGIDAELLYLYKEGNDWWIGTRNDGLYMIRNLFSKDAKVIYHWLKSNSISSVFRDHEGNLWTTTLESGAHFIRKNALSIKTLSHAYSSSLLFDGRTQTLTVGKNKATFEQYRANGALLKSVQLPVKGYNQVKKIIPLGNDSLVLLSNKGTYIYHAKSNQFTKITDLGLKDICLTADNHLLGCGVIRAYYYDRKHLTEKKEFPAKGKFTAISGHDSSDYYLGSTVNLLHVSSKGPREILSDTVLSSSVSSLISDGNRLWVGTSGNGIFVLKNDRIIQHITRKTHHIINDICQQLYDDGQYYLWIATNKGISVIDRNTYALVMSASVNDGLLSNDAKDIVTAHDTAYIATASGINTFRLKDLLTKSNAPEVYITRLMTNNYHISGPGRETKFPYFKGAVTLSFTAITFEAPEAIQYQYRFDHDEKWTNTLTSDISLYDLQPGTHQFKVRAKKFDSDWSAPVVFTMQVMPLWYQTIWAKGIVITALTILLTLVIRTRIQSIRKSEKEKTRLNNQINDLENKALAYQMNPHFIFNSLNTVQQFILEKDEEQSLHYLGDFATLMRQMLDSSRKTGIPLTEEIDFLNRYLRLEQTRFNHSFTFIFKVHDNLSTDEVFIPPALIQPVLENAVKHGVRHIKNGNILIEFKKQKKFLLCRVTDNGAGYHVNKSNGLSLTTFKSTALKVIEARLALMKTTEDQIGRLVIANRQLLNPQEKGTCVELFIPLLPK